MNTTHEIDLQRPNVESHEQQNAKAVAGFSVWAVAFLTAALSNMVTQPFFDMIIPDGGLALCFALVCDGFVALMVIAGIHAIGANSRVNQFGERLTPYLFKKLW